jgi:hypothetical protein
MRVDCTDGAGAAARKLAAARPLLDAFMAPGALTGALVLGSQLGVMSDLNDRGRALS